MNYALLFLIAFVVSALLIPVVKKLAYALDALDRPSDPRKIHTKPIPLLGGLAIYLSFVFTLAVYMKFFNPDYSTVPLKFLIGIVLGGLVLVIGGFLDDKYNLAPNMSIIAPIISALVLIFTGVGVGITIISNPLGGAPINLNFHLLFLPFSSVFIFFFVLGMIYTTKFLDGMDGLAAGISFIAGLTLFLLSLAPQIHQSVTASLSVIFCGAALGFLFFNFNPATIFLGEAGSTFIGYMLAALSVLRGGKIATAVLVMGIPIMDVAWVIVRRLWYGVSPFKADRKHLHFRLLDIGYSQKQTVLVLYFIAAIFGFVAIFLQTLGKLVALIILLVIMLMLAIFTVMVYKKKHPVDQKS